MSGLKMRGRPLIASRNAEQALTNLLAKRDILLQSLKNCSRTTAPDEVLQSLPKSVRQFNFWNGSYKWPGKRDLTVIFHANSNETLRANADLREEVQQLVNAVRKLGERKVVGRREDTLRALKAQLSAERELTAIANREVLRTRILLCDLRDMHESLRESKKSTNEEARARIDELELEIQKQEVEISGLRKILRSGKSLKSV